MIVDDSSASYEIPKKPEIFRLDYPSDSCRVGAILLAAKQGVPVPMISKLARHQSVQTTLDYLRNSPFLTESEKALLEVSQGLLDQALGSPQE